MEAILCLMVAHLHALSHLAERRLSKPVISQLPFYFPVKVLVSEGDSLSKGSAVRTRTDIKAHMIDSTPWNQD